MSSNIIAKIFIRAQVNSNTLPINITDSVSPFVASHTLTFNILVDTCSSARPSQSKRFLEFECCTIGDNEAGSSRIFQCRNIIKVSHRVTQF